MITLQLAAEDLRYRCADNICKPTDAPTLEAFKDLQAAINEGVLFINPTPYNVTGANNPLNEFQPVLVDGDIGSMTLRMFRKVSAYLILQDTGTAPDESRMPKIPDELAANAGALATSLRATLSAVKNKPRPVVDPSTQRLVPGAMATGGIRTAIPVVTTKTQPWKVATMVGVVAGAGVLALLLYRSVIKR